MLILFKMIESIDMTLCVISFLVKLAPIQYTVISQGYKNDYFQMNNSNIFLNFAQNIDFGYTLEPPQ